MDFMKELWLLRVPPFPFFPFGGELGCSARFVRTFCSQH